ncbi:MAG: hypothetical protein GKR88_02515 [Flavobacteriaceae bacterium]|nr:MAG: hypothetical protein GKR88_02515 [Flavobacteriaceae bacterium]
MKKTVFFLLTVFLFCNFIVKSQNQDFKWVAGISGTYTYYGNVSANVIKDKNSFQIPKFNVARYISKGITLDGSIILSTINGIEGFFTNSFHYFSVDFTGRYDFGLSNENLVPYAGFGFGFVGAPSTVKTAKTSISLNAVAGGTFWFSSNWGLNAQFVFKRLRHSAIKMLTNTQLSFGLVYSFEKRVLNYRIWDKKH